MRIVHVSDVYLPRLGGIELHVHDLARQQRLRGHEVRVLTGTTDPDGRPDPDGPTDGPAVSRLGATRWTRRLPPRLFADADVVHCHSSVVSPLAWSAARTAATAGAPVTVTMHSIVSGVGPAGPATAAAARALGRDIAWTAVSGVAARALGEVVRRPVSVLPNGIDLAAWPPARDLVGDAVDGPGRPGDGGVRTLVSVMRLCRRKRALPLLDILEQIRASTPSGVELRAVLIGDGPQRAVLERVIRSRGMGGWVHLTGRLDRIRVADHLRAASLFLAPATLESFGIAALEARSCGLPVVAMRAGGVGDFIRDGVNGLLADSDAQMAQLTAWLLGDPDSLGRIRAHNAGTPPSLDWAGVVERGLAVYRAAGAVDSAPVGGVAVGGVAVDSGRPVRRPDVVLAR